MPESTKEHGGPERPAEGGRNIRKDLPKSTPETQDLSAKTGFRRRSLRRLPRENRPPISVARERCQSGRSGRSRKPLCVQAYRGFESHPLRHNLLFSLDYCPICEANPRVNPRSQLTSVLQVGRLKLGRLPCVGPSWQGIEGNTIIYGPYIYRDYVLWRVSPARFNGASFATVIVV